METSDPKYRLMEEERSQEQRNLSSQPVGHTTYMSVPQPTPNQYGDAISAYSGGGYQPSSNPEQPAPYQYGDTLPAYSGGGYQPPQIQHGRVISQTVQCQPLPFAAQQNQSYVVNTTSVVTNQPQRLWRAGLCDCCNDCGVCACVFFCHACVECSLARRMDESCCVPWFPGGFTSMRTKFRMQHKIEGSLLDDTCVTVFCHPCAVCQLAREMNSENYPKVCCGNC